MVGWCIKLPAGLDATGSEKDGEGGREELMADKPILE